MFGFYSGGTNYRNRRQNFGKILSTKESFSCVSSEIYYDESKLKQIYDFSFFIHELDHFPTYEEIKSKYREKMVIKNGIHLIKVEPLGGQVIGKDKIREYIIKGQFYGNEFCITEMEQILPLLGITLQRNEYLSFGMIIIL